MIQVLWIDDEYKEKLDLVSRAEDLFGIQFHGYSTVNEGMIELERHFLKYDAIVLDAKCKIESENENPEYEGLLNSLGKLSELKALGKIIPRYILSAEMGNLSEPTMKSFLNGVPIFQKGSNNKDLFLKIKDDVANRDTYKIKHKYEDILTVFDKGYLNIDTYEKTLELLKFLESTERFNETNFNKLRKILEAISEKLESCGFFHSICETFKQKLFFLNGYLEVNDLILESKSFIPSYLRESFSYLWSVSSVGSHNSDFSSKELEDQKNQKNKLAELKQCIPNPHIQKAMIYQLLDILVWLNQLLGKEYTPDEIKANWKKANQENFQGTETLSCKVLVKSIKRNGWADSVSEDGSTIGIHPKFKPELDVEYQITRAWENGKLLITNLTPINDN